MAVCNTHAWASIPQMIAVLASKLVRALYFFDSRCPFYREQLVPFIFSLRWDRTSGVHMEKRVFSNGLTSPMSSSGTVRPSPNHKQRLDIHSCEKIGKQSPLGYCSVTRKGMSSIRQACKSLFDVSMTWGKYLMVGRNFSCISQSNRTEFWRDNGTASWAMLIITNIIHVQSEFFLSQRCFLGALPWLVDSSAMISSHRPLSFFELIFRTFSKWRNSSSIELFVVFSFIE